MSLGWLIFLHAVLHNAFTNNTTPFSQSGYFPFAYLPAIEQFILLQCLIVVSLPLYTDFTFTHWYFIRCSVAENDADKSKLVRVVRHVEMDNTSHPLPISHTAHTPSPPISALIISYTLIFALGSCEAFQGALVVRLSSSESPKFKRASIMSLTCFCMCDLHNEDNGTCPNIPLEN